MKLMSIFFNAKLASILFDFHLKGRLVKGKQCKLALVTFKPPSCYVFHLLTRAWQLERTEEEER